MIFSDAVRSIWYSLSDSVWLGATTMLSPVCTPIGSKFSMLQTVMQVAGAVAHHLVLDLFPAEQRLLDQHLVDRAGREAAARRCARSSSSVCAMPPPVPPSV